MREACPGNAGLTTGLVDLRAGCQLVSVTENLEATPSGKLVQGIHALMAEFYSSNLSAEVRKGMTQKGSSLDRVGGG